MSMKARTFSLSKSFMEGISPTSWSERHGCISGLRCHGLPLMILQKMHDAAMLVV
jgi:hypothetical protein